MSKKNIIDEEDFFGIPDMLDGKHQIIPIIPDDEDLSAGITMPDIMPILTLRSSVLFPGAISPVTVGRNKSVKLIREVEKQGGILGAVLQRDPEVESPDPEDMYKIGTVAKILKTLEMPNGNLTVILHGIEKIEVEEYVSATPYFKAKVKFLKDTMPESSSVEFTALVDSIKEVAINIVNNSTNMPKEILFAIKNVDSPRGLINLVCSNIDLDDKDRQHLLEASGLLVRARRLLEVLIREQQLLELRNDIQRKVKQDIDQQQRDYFLQQQLRTIQDELGGDSSDKEINEFQEKALKKKWPAEVREVFFKELSKIERMNPAVAEYSVQMNYLQLMLDLPWNHCTKDNLDLNRAKKRLDADHFGLEEVKERILEHLAVLKLKGDLKAPIICLYGPPGVGKTSLGKSVAEALKRKFGRISLGGLHDEAEIRGHRKTYIGAMPGRIIQTIRRCGSSNPVIILDEIDKVSASNHGDPSSALLEVLDPEQNTTFHDNYLDIEYDLSNVLFIATANNISSISPALRDRMEMINVSGYILEDKIEIAKRHLVSKELEAQGVKSRQFKLKDSMIEKIIAEYTRESGVRTLSKRISKLVRRRAKNIGFEEKFVAEVSPEFIEDVLGVPRYKNDKYDIEDVIGVVTGLAWTEVGGDILYIESMLVPSSKGGALTMTGNLGNVMKESATIALQWVKAHAVELGIDPEIFEKNDVHIHVPEGAVPKDGPSAGITMVTSMVSTLTSRCVNDKFAMTGETTLRGKVLPVGGIKEKILAAKRAGITDLIICHENQKDVDEVKKEYLEGLTFHYVKTLDDVLALALK